MLLGDAGQAELMGIGQRLGKIRAGLHPGFDQVPPLNKGQGHALPVKGKALLQEGVRREDEMAGR